MNSVMNPLGIAVEHLMEEQANRNRAERLRRQEQVLEREAQAFEARANREHIAALCIVDPIAIEDRRSAGTKKSA